MPKRTAQTPEEDARRAASRAEEVERDLRNIYDEGGRSRSAAEMRSLERADRSIFRRALVGMTVFFAVLAAISWAGFFLFSPAGGGFKGEKVELTVDGPEQVKSGELVAYAVHYKNGEGTPLGTAGIEIRLPKQFTLIESEPNATDGAWRIGSVAPGKEGSITLKGYFRAPVDKVYDMQAILTYRPADFNSEFQKVSTRGIMVKDSVLDLVLTGPAKVLPGDKVTLVYAYKNPSENPFTGLRLRPAYPEGFIPESSVPAGDDKGFVEWTIDDLIPGKEGKVTIAGSYSSEAEGAREAKGVLGFIDDAGAFQQQKEAAAAMEIVKGDLVTSLILNGKSTDQPVRFGDMLRYTLSYKNTGTASLQNVELSLQLSGSPSADAVVWNDLKDKAKGVRTGDTVLWTKKQIPSLAEIGAGEEGALDVEVPFMPAPLAKTAGAENSVTALVQAKIGSIDDQPSDRIAKTAPIAAVAVSDAAFSAMVRYFDEDDIPVGTGPLPPKVGEQTVYRATWTVANSLHDLSDLKLSAKLPPNVVWTGKSSVDAGDLRFDAATGKMVWTLNWMPTNVPKLTVSFDVGITPGDDQKGKVPTLVDGAILEATDKANGFPLLLSASPLTTAAEGDPGAAAKGRVE